MKAHPRSTVPLPQTAEAGCSPFARIKRRFMHPLMCLHCRAEAGLPKINGKMDANTSTGSNSGLSTSPEDTSTHGLEGPGIELLMFQ